MSYILVLDQGTHASRAIVFSLSGDIIEQAQQAVSLQRISHDIIEQNADELLNSLIQCIKKINKNTLKKVTRCCLTTQRSTTVAWHSATGAAFAPAISWQDRRSDDDLKQFNHQQTWIKKITGLPLSAHYGAGKIRWLITQHAKVNKALQDNTLCIGPLVSFLLFNLLKNKPFSVDHSNAHRSLLFALQTLDWSDDLLTLFNIPKKILPKCRPVRSDFGHLIINNIPVTAVCGDQSAAFFSLGRVAADSALINIGTGAFILSPCDNINTQSRLLCGIAYSDAASQQFLLEGTVNGAGAALSWAQKKYPVESLFDVLPGWLKQITSPPVFINTIGGLGSPWWRSSVEGYFLNDKELDTASRYVAIIESIAFLIQHNLLQMQKTIALKRLRLSGGLSQLNGLCQKIADLSQLSVERISATEATASGGAWLAADCPDKWRENDKSDLFSADNNSALLSRFQQFSAEIHRLE
jgi:glycerol kinase